jgi:hypothetical protein
MKISIQSLCSKAVLVVLITAIPCLFSCSKSCDTCSVSAKENTRGISVTIPFTSKVDCDEAKANKGKTIIENGSSVTITDVSCN